MQVLRSKRAGFCMGVALALKKLDVLVETKENVATFGPIIHNPFVLAEYSEKGVSCFKNTQEVESANPLNLLIRAHGIPCTTERYLESIPHVTLSDATCPRVKEAQKSIKRATSSQNSENPKTLLLYGDANHPEVDGLVSYAMGRYKISTDINVLMSYTKEHIHEKIVLAAQTTQDRPTFDILQKKLKEITQEIEILDTICDATRLRQEEALELAKKVEIMVVVGGKESGNTKRLAEIVFSQNIPTVFIETAEELQRESFEGVNIVGITAGASTPKYLVDKTEELLLSW